MESKVVGFIGAGNMAQAIAKGFFASQSVLPKNVIVSARTNAVLSTVWSRLGTMTTLRNSDVVTNADVIFLCVKPDILPTVLDEISNDADDTWREKIFVSVVAGATTQFLEGKLSCVPDVKVIRTGVNTPCLVQCGVIIYTLGTNCSKDDESVVVSLMKNIGHVEQVDEKYRNAMGGLMGCSPAWFYTVIEGISDGGVKNGVPRDVSYRLISKAMEGAAKMVLTSDMHVGQLKDDAATPNGSTICGLYELEQAGVRGMFMRAVEAVTDRHNQLAK